MSLSRNITRYVYLAMYSPGPTLGPVAEVVGIGFAGLFNPNDSGVGALGRMTKDTTKEAAPSVVGARHGHRERTLTGAFGKTRIAVPRARLTGEDGKTREWRRQILRPPDRARPRRARADRPGANLPARQGRCRKSRMSTSSAPRRIGTPTSGSSAPFRRTASRKNSGASPTAIGALATASSIGR